MVEIAVDDDGICVTDNGPGLPAETIGSILDFTVRVSSREAYVSPTRGAQGNALKTIVAMPFVLDGSHGRVEIEARGLLHSIDFSIDRIRQEPVVEHQVGPSNVTTGTRFRVKWPVSACSIDDARERFLQIASDYTWLNPHCEVSARWFGEDVVSVEATAPGWQKWKPSDPTSPHWYGVQHVERLIAAYIAHDADNGRERTVREFVAEFRGLSGTAKQKAVLDATGLSREPLSRLINGKAIDSDIVERLLREMQNKSKPVKPEALGVIGKEHFHQRFSSIGCEMESFDYRCVRDVTDSVPWVVETAFGWCPDIGSRRLVTGVNWSPGIINPFRELGGYGRSLDTVLSQQRATSEDPIVMVLHMACPKVEYTDRGKSAVVIR